MNKYYCIENKTEYAVGQCYEGKWGARLARIVGIVKGSVSGVAIIMETVSENGAVQIKTFDPKSFSYKDRDMITAEAFLAEAKILNCLIDEKAMQLTEEAVDEPVVVLTETVDRSEDIKQLLQSMAAVAGSQIEIKAQLEGIHEFVAKGKALEQIEDRLSQIKAAVIEVTA